MTSPFTHLTISENTRSSRTLALTNPRRFGLEIVKVHFEQACYSSYQGVAKSGDFVVLLGMRKTFVPHRFDYVENGVAHFTSIRDIDDE